MGFLDAQLLDAVSRHDLALHISVATALWGSTFVSVSFVALLYLWRFFGVYDEDRDDPGTIRRRFVSAFLCCCSSAVLIVALCGTPPPGVPGLSVVELLGFQSDGLVWSCGSCFALIACLFAGPLTQELLAFSGRGHRGAVRRDPQEAARHKWVAMRNYILAPIAEEVVFRACLCRLWVGAGIPTTVIVFCTPCWFSLAHAHHYLEHVRRRGDTLDAMVQVVFQIFYTSIFGALAAYMLLRTGSTIAVIIVHSFCNHMGFPDISWAALPRHPLYPKR
eukprot:CAMPEP_0178449040 /NCGR_PEP_ID=MMETSP0689_2-20121128/42321_1 /TAXON_ID=160604 /ORGANISM="Amphidinium massartii, Strain CS-259" /LENGTH=276 /DNA_ID=CAMNT_0020074297 /DNA_START=81 /DNA_END=908 /DNA_ORIENTATION=-